MDQSVDNVASVVSAKRRLELYDGSIITAVDVIIKYRCDRCCEDIKITMYSKKDSEIEFSGFLSESEEVIVETVREESNND